MRHEDPFLTWPKVAGALLVLAIRHGDQPLTWVGSVMESHIDKVPLGTKTLTAFLANFRKGAKPEERAAAKAISHWGRCARKSRAKFELRIVREAFYEKACAELARLRRGEWCVNCDRYAMKEPAGRTPWRFCPCATRTAGAARIHPEFVKASRRWATRTPLPALEVTKA